MNKRICLKRMLIVAGSDLVNRTCGNRLGLGGVWKGAGVGRRPKAQGKRPKSSEANLKC